MVRFRNCSESRTLLALRSMLGLGPRTVVHHGRVMQVQSSTEETPSWMPPILKTVATRGEGVPEVVDAVERHRAFLVESGEMARREEARVAHELDAILRDALVARLVRRVSPETYQAVVHRIVARELDPYTAAQELMSNESAASAEPR